MKRLYLYVTPFFPTPQSWRGGYSYDAVKALMKQGRHDVRVVVPGKGPDYEYHGIKVIRFRWYAFPFGLCPFLLSALNGWMFLRALKRVGIDVSCVSVVHANTMTLSGCSVAVKILNRHAVALVQHHCTCPVRLESGRLGRVPFHSMVLYFYLRRLCEKVDAHVFVSETSRRSFGKCFVNGPESELVDVKSQLALGHFMRPIRLGNSYVLYNGIDTSVFCPAPRKRLDGDRKFVIGCVANFQPLKDQITLIKAVERLIKDDGVGDISLRFVGSGECLDTCRKYVAAHGLDTVVSFEKEMDHLELPEFYQSLDLFVLPSRLEGFCCSYVEAHGCGVPVIGCKGVSIEEVLSKEECDRWLISPMDVDGLARKIAWAKNRREQQTFCRPLDIEQLIVAFLDWVDSIHA